MDIAPSRRRSVLGFLLAVAMVAGCASTPAVTLAPGASSEPAGSPASLAPQPTGGGTNPSQGPVATIPPGAAVLVGAGDIADCDHPIARATASLVAGIAGTVFTAGDDAYEDGTPDQFHNCYDPTWGAFKDRTMPAAGNHDFKTPGGAGYFDYFGSVAGAPGDGWYSYELGAWHVVVLNSNCTIVGCTPDSPQLAWLRADLAAHPAACTMAIWHHPLFSSGVHGSDVLVRPFWDALFAAGVDVIVNGHDHDYERFAPQTPFGLADPAHGIREFVVGTGGAKLRPFEAIVANSEVRNADTYGVIAFTLRPTSYSWRFVPIAGQTFTDSGTGTCH